MKFTLLSFLIFTLAYSVVGQVSKDSLLAGYMQEVKEKVAMEDFKSAEQTLFKAFSLKTILPDEAAFYYGFIQVRLKNYVKGKEGLQKYIQLTEGAGSFYSETLSLLEEANANICKRCNNTGIAEKKDTCLACNGIGEKEEDCDHCRLKGQEICSSCQGKGVVVYKNSLGTSYSECSRCQGKGVIVCSNCGGTKKKKKYCSECKGVGFFKRKVNCDHHIE